MHEALDERSLRTSLRRNLRILRLPMNQSGEKKEENTLEILTKEEMPEHITCGFPSGEFAPGELLCPRCGEKNLIQGEQFQAQYFSPSIDKIVADKTVTVYSCPVCGMKFLTYGPFFEII